MRADHAAQIERRTLDFFADRPTDTVSEWCEANLVFDEPDNRGPFSLAGREYIREPLDSFADPMLTDGVLVLGSQAGKTGIIMGGAAWTARNDPARIVWVMSAEGQAQTFSSTRWQPLLRASPCMAELLPTGSRRFEVKALQQTIGASIVNFFGSNSPGNLASIPARVVIQDEVDKYDTGGRKEADASNLADQRTKKFANPKRFKASTPTLTDGLIWQEFLKTDQRRRFLPCPHCGKLVLLAWSKHYTTFVLTGAEAFAVWDKEAKRGQTWDLDRVERSAHYECPHCGGHITDAHKTRMDRAGEWRATAKAATGYRGWHLSSLYASSAQTTVGKLAVKFLQVKRSLLGLQGFINGDLAEVFENQDSRSARTELIVVNEAPEPGTAPIPILTADVQEVAPYFWYVVRIWYAEGHSRRIAWGHCDSWEELRAIQLQHSVADNHVGVDSGYDAQTVYSQCLKWGKMVQLPNGQLPMWVGWTPLDGRPGYAKFRDPKTGQPRLYDFSSARLSHTKFRLPLLGFNSWALKDILAKMRRGPEQAGGFRWEVGDDPQNETYWRHLDAEVKAETARGRFEWKLRSKRWPNHLLDCEVGQLAMANFHRRLLWAAGSNQQTEEPKKESNATA